MLTYRILAGATLATFLGACGGKGSSPIAPPTGLTYSTNPATYIVGTAIAPDLPSSSGGAVASYSVSPSLPVGLNLDLSTGVISGTPTAVESATNYNVTANNAGGSTTVSLSITVAPASNPLPTISGLAPASAAAAGPAFLLEVDGTGFVTASSVEWNGVALTTTFTSATKLSAMVPANCLASAGTATVVVVNPSPGGGASADATFTISACPIGSSLVSLTVKNYLSWCSVSVAGIAPSTSPSVTICVAAGSVPLSAMALVGFELGGATWHDTAGDHGAGDPGTVTGSGQSATSSTTVVANGSATCVWACCPFSNGSGCPSVNQCP